METRHAIVVLRRRRGTTLVVAFVILFASATIAQGIDLLAPSNTYDYILLTHDNLYTEALRLFNPRNATLRTCIVKSSEVATTFGGGQLTDQAIRDFVVYAYQNWAIIPTYLLLVGDANMDVGTYDLIPTHLSTNEFDSFEGNSEFADDGYYVGSPFVGDRKPIIHVGRIPARNATELSKVIDKIIYYDGITGSPAWLDRTLFLVGNASPPAGGPNFKYGNLSDKLRDSHSPGLGSITTLYSLDYELAGPSWPLWLLNATQATRDQFNLGVGFVNAFGNTTSNDPLVYMADFDVNPLNPPTFTQGLTGTNFLPVVFTGSCLINYFYKDQDLCIGEDLLFGGNDRGAVAVVGADHVNYIDENYKFNNVFLDLMANDGIRNLGRLLSASKSISLLSGIAYETLISQFHLLGDPAVDIRLNSLPAAKRNLNGGEIEDAPVLQDNVVANSAGISNESLRVVHNDAGVSPLAGERMIRVQLTDSPGSADYVEWKIQDLDLDITENMVMSFWINVVQSPAGADRLVVDGNTTIGRIKDQASIVDQTGTPLNAAVRLPLDDGWQLVYADLSSLVGQKLLDIRVRYETSDPSETGVLTAYIDEIRIEQIEFRGWSGQEVLNSSFEDDKDANTSPDAWTDLLGMIRPSHVRSDNLHSFEGNYSVAIYDSSCAGDGAQHIFHSNPTIGTYAIEFYHQVHDSTTTFTITIVNANDGITVLTEVISTGVGWNFWSETFINPDLSQSVRVKVQIVPNDCNFVLNVDNLVVRRADVCRIPGYVRNAVGAGAAGIAVEGIDASTGLVSDADTTDSNGFYELLVNLGWSGEVTPRPRAYNNDHSPTAGSFTNVSAVTSLLNFTISHRSTGWIDSGLPICNNLGAQNKAEIHFDDQGGAFVAWQDGRYSGSQLFMQRVSGGGEVLWPSADEDDGLFLFQRPYTHSLHRVVSDGAGGAVITWMDDRERFLDLGNMYAQKFDGNGNKLWVSDDVSLCTSAGLQKTIDIVSDSGGNVIVSWLDYRSGNADIYAQRVLSDGSVDWVLNGWPISTGPSEPWNATMIADGQGGAILAWEQGVPGFNSHIFAEKIDSNHNWLWGSGTGRQVSTVPEFQENTRIISDGSGGAIFVWEHFGSPLYNLDIHAQRMLASGASAPTWGADGIVVCDVLLDQQLPEIVSDGQGGAIVVWFDKRSGNQDVYAQRVDTDGITQWLDDGVVVCDNVSSQTSINVVPDGMGGAVVVWVDDRSGDQDIYMQRIDAGTGNRLWDLDGLVLVAAPGNQRDPRLTRDSAGTIIAVWVDERFSNSPDIYARKIELDPNYKSGLITSSQTWQGQIYITGDLTVAENATVTINPNTDIFVWSVDGANTGVDPARVELNIEGTIDVNGTEANPVRFVTWDGSKENNGFGSWVGFYFDSQSSGGSFDWCTIKGAETAIETYVPVTLDNCVIDTVGYAGVSAWNTDVTLGNSTVQNSNTHGVVLNGSGATIVNCTIQECAGNGVYSSGPGALFLQNTDVLNNDIGLYVANNGTYGSVHSICEFKNNDIGVYFHNAVLPEITHAVIDNNTTDGMYLDQNSHATIKLCITSDNYSGTISNNATGIYCNNGSSPVILQNTIQGNTVGIAAVNNANPDAGGGPSSLGENIIAANTVHHIANLTPGITIMAENNWWGSSRPPRSNKFSGAVDYLPVAPAQPNPAEGQDGMEQDSRTPAVFRLSQNAPNPFNPTTRIHYEVPGPGGVVTIRVYNVAGQFVRELVNEWRGPGMYDVLWDGRNSRGIEIASGVYFLQMMAPNFRVTKKAVFLK